MPINKKDHWFTVIIVNLPTLYKIICERISVNEFHPSLRPYILLLDPLVNVEENLDLMLRLYLECELADTIGPTYKLMQTDKSEGGLSEEDTLLINEQNLPHFQLIVKTAYLDPSAKKHLRLWSLRPRIYGKFRAEPKLHLRPNSRNQGISRLVSTFLD
jgi:hypothetical protein